MDGLYRKVVFKCKVADLQAEITMAKHELEARKRRNGGLL